jgi:very-short-patch-repair endonuclease
MDLSVLTAFAEEHHGLVTMAAATDKGVSRATWFRCLHDGRLIALHRSVARLPGATASIEQTIHAAVLATGPGSLASHRTAARLWGIPRPDDDPIEVIVTHRGRSPDIDGVIVHRPRDNKDLEQVLRSGIPTSNILRLLCDLGAVDAGAVSAAVGHVLSARLASPVALRRAIDRHSRRGRHGVPAFRDALDDWLIDGKPADSDLERVMRRLFEDHRLPPFEFHAIIVGFEVDFWIIGSPIVLECDGWAFHAKTRAQQARDAERDATLAEAGYVPVRFTYDQIVRRAAQQARRIAGLVKRWAPNLDLGANPSQIRESQIRD